MSERSTDTLRNAGAYREIIPEEGGGVAQVHFMMGGSWVEISSKIYNFINIFDIFFVGVLGVNKG